MRSAITTAVLVLLAAGAYLIWERFKRRRLPPSKPQKPDAQIMAYAFSFQTDLTFTEVAGIVGAAGGENPAAQSAFGHWFERDSAWYDNLLSCDYQPGVRMNLYFFSEENVLEIKLAPMCTEALKEWEVLKPFVLNELFPAIRARDIKPTCTVD